MPHKVSLWRWPMRMCAEPSSERHCTPLVARVPRAQPMSPDCGLHRDVFLVQRTALPGSSWLCSPQLRLLVSEPGLTRLS